MVLGLLVEQEHQALAGFRSSRWNRYIGRYIWYIRYKWGV
jgi:hypothetical protein